MGKVIETVVDAIAIEILDRNTILIGKGNQLHLYIKSVTKKKNVFDIQELPIKLSNKIHGIKRAQNVSDNLFLVYGGKEFILSEYNEDLKVFEVYRAELSDWISCGLFLKEPNQIVLLTAHSILLRLCYDVVRKECCLKERVSCVDKSTLYCAHLFGNKWNELIVFGGNAFGELLIWQPWRNEENTTEPLKPKLSPLLHRILAHNGVIFSIDYDPHSQCLVTTSDDRAIKWWKVEFKTKTSWCDIILQALSSGYGHSARVFQARIIKDGSSIYALSGGEDSNFCLWNKSGQLLFKRRQQYGAIIWNFIYDDKDKTIYTVGSTGNLVAFGLSQVLQETNYKIKTNFLLPTPAGGDSMEYIAKIKFLNENHLIGLTNQNNLMVSKLSEEKWLNWEKSSLSINFKCTIVMVYRNIIAICGYKRLILLETTVNCMNFNILYDGEVLKGMIRTFIFLNEHQYLICDDQGNSLIFLDSLNNKRHLQIPKCKEPWITTALLLNQQYIAISNRQGNLLLYQFQQQSNTYELKHTIKHPHGNLGATSLTCLEETPTSSLIRSTGHDGAVKIFLVDFIKSTIQHCARQIIPVTWVESVAKFQNNLEIFLGFNDNHFVVWCNDYDFLLQIPCGGGHRCWDFQINHKSNTICMAFIQNKRVRFYKMPLLNKELTELPLAKRWHTAPCNTMQILSKTTSSHHIAVSGGDDNLLKIHTFSMQFGLKQQKELHNHISNVRCLKVVTLNENEFLVFSGGGRAQLCITKVNSSNFHVNEMINFTLKQENKNENCNSKLYNFDPETRLMSLDVKVLNKEEYEIFIGCSDGFIKLLKFNLETLEIVLLAQHFYSKCILQIGYVIEADLVLVAATDGILNIFNSALSECLYQLQHHSSGVNCLSFLYKISSKSLIILSGGDDQAVCYTELSLKDLNSLEVMGQFRKPHLHTSQVCACALSSNGVYGFTSGVDQILNKINLSTGEVIDSFYSCVADIKGLALIDNNVCLLFGCGLQIYAFKS